MEDREDSIDPRLLPGSDLDLSMMITDSVWGRKEVPVELRDKLNRYFLETDNNGKTTTIKSSMWGMLGYLTRDIRLANLSTFDNELQTCRHHLEVANDLLDSDMEENFIIELSRAAAILETSQSKGGFLRRSMNTLRQEHIRQEIEPPKKGFFGGGKPKHGGF